MFLLNHILQEGDEVALFMPTNLHHFIGHYPGFHQIVIEFVEISFIEVPDMMDDTRRFLQSLGLPGGDAYDLDRKSVV